MRIQLWYPSGNTATVIGEWRGPITVEGQGAILIDITKRSRLGSETLTVGSALLGDPRGVYVNQDTGAVLYTPREHMTGMQDWARNWLEEHPSWPGVLELNEAPFAPA